MTPAEIFRQAFCTEFLTQFDVVFQDWFARLARHLHTSGDLQPVRSTRGDGGLDCFVVNQQIVYQVYAPRHIKDGSTAKKIRGDFENAFSTLQGCLRSWRFVHNDPAGAMGKKMAAALSQLKSDYPQVDVAVWNMETLWDQVRKLPEDVLALLFNVSGSSPTPELFLPPIGLPHSADVDVYRLLHWESALAERLVGRDGQLAELLAWAQTTSDPERPKIIFMTGPGGSGKTRLAFEVAHTLRKLGWTAGFAPPEFVRVRPVQTKGLFVVVDYPEERRGEVVQLWRSLSAISAISSPIRILLLSRQESIADWDLELSESHARRFLTRQNLSTGALTTCEAQQLFDGTCRRLAAHLNVAPPDLASPEFGPWVQRDPTLHALPLFVLAATVHVTLLRQPLAALSAREVLEALVERELDRMRNAAHELRLDRQAAERLSALSALAGDLDVATLRRLAEESVGLRLPAPNLVLHYVDRLLWWQHERWAGPKPDLLAAVHTWMTLGRDQLKGHAVSEWLWTALCGAIPPNRTEASDAPWARQVDRVLYDILRIEGGEAYQEARKWLTGMVRGEVVRAVALEPLLSMAPVLRALTGLAISVAAVLRPQRRGDPPAEAKLLNRVSVQFAAEGRFDEALEAATDAVRLYKTLASNAPMQYSEDLTSALHNQSIWLSKAGGRTQESLTVAIQAVDGYRQLAESEPQRYITNLADALSNLSSRLSETGREAEALAIIQEAEGIRRSLARHDTDTYESELARTLTNLSNVLSTKGQYDKALIAAEEAIDIRRRLARMAPSLYEADLAITLNNAANLLGTLGRPQEAVSLLREVLAIHERLVAALPVRYEPDLALNLINLSVHLWAVGQSRESLDTIERAAGIYRQLATTAPERHELNLARSLYNLSDRQSAFGDTQAGLLSIEQAVVIYRQLVKRNSSAHEAELAMALDSQQNQLGKVGRHDEAINAGEAAEAILRKLAAASFDRYAIEHARTLSNLSSVLAATKQLMRALAATDEAMATVRRLTAAHPERYASELAQVLNNRLRVLLDLDRNDEAINAGREAVAIRRTQSASLPDRFEPDLARALSNLSLTLAAHGLLLDAVGAAEEGSIIYRRLHLKEPRAWARRFSKTLSDLGNHQLRAGMVEAAVATLGEGVPLARALAEENSSAHSMLFKEMLELYIEALNGLGDDMQRSVIEAELATWTST